MMLRTLVILLVAITAAHPVAPAQITNVKCGTSLALLAKGLKRPLELPTNLRDSVISRSRTFVIHYDATLSNPDVNVADGSLSDPGFSCGIGFFTKGGGRVPTARILSLDTSDTAYLFMEALQWDKVEPQKGMDTMRLFVERYPHYYPYNANALNFTVTFASELAQHDTFIDRAVWIEEYNWLASVYTLDTGSRYRFSDLANMAACAIYIDRNLAANLWYNIGLLFPGEKGTADHQISEIRFHQSRIPEDTTAFYLMDIPPAPYLRVGDRHEEPVGISLLVSPNPTPGGLHISATIAPSSRAIIEIFDQLGNRVETCYDQRSEAGKIEVEPRLSALPNGTYYVRLATPREVSTRSVTLAR